MSDVEPIAPGRAFRDPVLLAATVLGSGCAPRAPGTAGTVLATLLWVPAALYLQLELQWALVLASALLGIPLCAAAARRLGVHDHSGIVWDELAGIWLALALLMPQSWVGWSAAFVLFRLLDIAKPWPISWLDRRIGGGAGIMLDDLIAGAVAGGALVLARPWLPVTL